MSSSYSKDTIIKSFLNSIIKKITGEPTYPTIKEVERVLIENSYSMQSDSGGGQHFHLCLVSIPTKYVSISGITLTQMPSWEPHKIKACLIGPSI